MFSCAHTMLSFLEVKNFRCLRLDTWFASVRCRKAKFMKSNNKKLLVVGQGTIGSHLFHRLIAQRRTVITMRRANGDPAAIRSIKNLGGVFLAIPSMGKGNEALAYMEAGLAAGVPIVTCEKAALAHHWKRLSPSLNRIGFSAAVGGGSMMLAQQPLLSTESKSIVAVVNATLNCIQTTEAIRGDKAVLANIRDRGVCEQGESTLAEVIEQELNDVAMKAVILWNHEMGTKRAISLKKGMLFSRKKTDIAATILNRKLRRNYRVVVCIADSILEFHNHISPFLQHQDENMMLRAGLIDLKQMRLWFSNFFGNFPDGIECKLVRSEGYRKVAVSGDGGGRYATVAAMFEDATRLGMV